MKKNWIIFLVLFLTIFSLIIDISTKLDFTLGPLSIKKDLSFRKGLDLAGGTSVILKADMKNISYDQKQQALESAKNVIERRVNFFGVSEPLVQTSTTNKDFRIIVELPGITDIDQAVKLIGNTAQLEFREVIESTASGALTTKSIGLSGADLRDAKVNFDSNTGEPVVSFAINPKSQKKFYETTQKLIGKRMAIFLDNIFVSAPVVQNAIRDNGQISGKFTPEDAKRLTTQLAAGALPVKLSILQQNSIGATLGKSTVEKSLLAGILGFITIVMFMIILYGRLGVWASIALCFYVLIVLAVFKLISLTLTLAGIAGFILSIGMAVDANILIFERMKEEERIGKPKDAAIELGFSRAWNSIRDSNISSLITSFILYYFGNGIIRGFALTLAIGVLVSMFSAITVTRTLLRIFYRSR